MKTTTTRLPEYSKYGEVHFELNGQSCKLEVYHNSDIANGLGMKTIFLSRLLMTRMEKRPMMLAAILISGRHRQMK
jgi:hypothetical protein